MKYKYHLELYENGEKIIDISNDDKFVIIKMLNAMYENIERIVK